VPDGHMDRAEARRRAIKKLNFPLLPFSHVVEQDDLKNMLKVAYVMGSSVGGVLVSGDRGTAKSTIVRSFAAMMYDGLPTTLPINATDDRVMGGWDIKALMEGRSTQKEGLLELANLTGMLYIDEVNLLDDHIVNLILDVVSTGVLVVERDGINDQEDNVSFMLVGTMNPDEGSLRPQMLDRFGLFVQVEAVQTESVRASILETVMRFDVERDWPEARSDWLRRGRDKDARLKAHILAAEKAAPHVRVTAETIKLCAHVAAKYEVVGHRAEIVMAKAARAVAALEGHRETVPGDVRTVAKYAIRHRRREVVYPDSFEWSLEDQGELNELIPPTPPRG
jgi:magnesium chelatase subunit I